MIKVQVNGTAYELPATATLASAVAAVTTAERGIAVALDEVVVPRGQWSATLLEAGARVEVVTAVQGG